MVACLELRVAPVVVRPVSCWGLFVTSMGGGFHRSTSFSTVCTVGTLMTLGYMGVHVLWMGMYMWPRNIGLCIACGMERN